MNSYRVLVPVTLGLIAGGANLLTIRGLTAPLEVVTVSRSLKAGEELTPDCLEKLELRGDEKLLRSAVPWGKRGEVLGRRISRALDENEILLFRDVDEEVAGDVADLLQPGERSQTVPVRSDRIVHGLRVGHQVVFLTESAVVGPFRLVGLSTRPDPDAGLGRRAAMTRKVVVAVPGRPVAAPAAVASLEKVVSAAQLQEDYVRGVEIDHAGR
jgi:hypothetical protein